MRMSAGEPPWMLELEGEESWLLGVLLDFYRPLVDPDDEQPEEPAAQPDGPGETDSFAFWEADVVGDDADRREEDPALLRLFPDAYPDDPSASADFRRFTLSGQRRERLDDIATVRKGLELLETGPLPIGADDLDPWLRVTNALRLVLASRLGIVDEVSAEEAERGAQQDPSDIVHPAYEWLGVFIEILVEVSWGRI